LALPDVAPAQDLDDYRANLVVFFSPFVGYRLMVGGVKNVTTGIYDFESEWL
jgi:hypothetical protein